MDSQNGETMKIPIEHLGNMRIEKRNVFASEEYSLQTNLEQ